MPELKSQLLKVPPKAPPGTSQYESLAVLLLELRRSSPSSLSAARRSSSSSLRAHR